MQNVWVEVYVFRPRRMVFNDTILIIPKDRLDVRHFFPGRSMNTPALTYRDADMLPSLAIAGDHKQLSIADFRRQPKGAEVGRDFLVLLKRASINTLPTSAPYGCRRKSAIDNCL